MVLDLEHVSQYHDTLIILILCFSLHCTASSHVVNNRSDYYLPGQQVFIAHHDSLEFLAILFHRNWNLLVICSFEGLFKVLIGLIQFNSELCINLLYISLLFCNPLQIIGNRLFFHFKDVKFPLVITLQTLNLRIERGQLCMNQGNLSLQMFFSLVN